MSDLAKELSEIPNFEIISWLEQNDYITVKMGGNIVKRPFKVGELEYSELRECVYIHHIVEELDRLGEINE